MSEPQDNRLVGAVLRCYPARWRRRHGDEAAELAALLIGDGIPAASIACSYLAGAARAWLTPRPGRRLSAVACALLVAACSLGVPAGLLASTASAASAASTSHSHAHPDASGHAHAHSRPGSHEPVPGMSPAICRQLASLPGAGHDQPC
jgi:hypothetical protein